MSDQPTLDLTLGGAPPEIIVQSRAVSVGEWYQIALLLADRTPPAGAPMPVRPERFIRQRIALLGLLTELGVGITADEGVRQLLNRSREDQRALTRAVRGEGAAVQFELDRVDADGRRVIRELREFQVRDYGVLAGLRHGANFSVPGSGKTTVTYALHHRERAAGRANRLLVVAPISAFGAWEDDVREVLRPPLRVVRWRPGDIGDWDVLLVNYQRLPGAVEPLTEILMRHPTHLVVDEAHRAKRGAAGEWGRALLALAPFAVRRDVLTGTPAPNQPRDLATMMEILWPGGAVLNMIPPAALRTDPPQTAMRDLNNVVAPLYVRTTKNELGLRDPIIGLDVVEMGDLQRQIYDAMLDRYAGMFDLDRRDAAMFAQMGEVMMYLLQAASSPRLLSRTADVAHAYRYPPLAIPAGSRLARLVDDYGDHEVPAKIERACRIVFANARENRKTLVWSNFPDNLLDLELQLAGLNPALIYGAIPSTADDPVPGVRTREGELDRFRSDPDCMVLLANPAAMSEGVSLHQCCHDAVYIDRTFNAGQYLQSLDRIHRLGLDPEIETRITLLACAGTIDERVNGRVEDKTRRLALMLDDPFLVQMALPDDEDAGAVVGDELDLEAIMEHLAQGIHRQDGP